ncbi:MAG: hypothetical protein KME26_29430 [Oscillatoria princeps RMCB-10]|nr:hypothetical protein [Oscillatoria princeps RMCB-10]
MGSALWISAHKSGVRSGGTHPTYYCNLYRVPVARKPIIIAIDSQFRTLGHEIQGIGVGQASRLPLRSLGQARRLSYVLT